MTSVPGFLFQGGFLLQHPVEPVAETRDVSPYTVRFNRNTRLLEILYIYIPQILQQQGGYGLNPTINRNVQPFSFTYKTKVFNKKVKIDHINNM